MLDMSHYTLTPDDKLLYETWRSFRDIGCYEDQEHRGFVLYQTAQTPGMLSFDVLIHFVYVSPAFRRQGIGRTLVDRIDKEKRTGAFCLDRPIFWRRIGWHVNGFIATNKPWQSRLRRCNGVAKVEWVVNNALNHSQSYITRRGRFRASGGSSVAACSSWRCAREACFAASAFARSAASGVLGCLDASGLLEPLNGLCVLGVVGHFRQLPDARLDARCHRLGECLGVRERGCFNRSSRPRGRSTPRAFTPAMNHGALSSLKRACRIKPTDCAACADCTLHDAAGIFRAGTCTPVFFHGEYVDDYKPFVIQVHLFRSLRGHRGPVYVITESRSHDTFCEFTLESFDGCSVAETLDNLLGRAWATTDVGAVAQYVEAAIVAAHTGGD
jgi:GNAT superfamily N-acetyltransferase